MSVGLLPLLKSCDGLLAYANSILYHNDHGVMDMSLSVKLSITYFTTYPSHPCSNIMQPQTEAGFDTKDHVKLIYFPTLV